MAEFRIPGGAWLNIVPQERVKGLKVRTLREMRNGFTIMPAGTECTIRSVQAGGINIEGPPCDHCKVKVYMSRVPRADVELLPYERCGVCAGPVKDSDPAEMVGEGLPPERTCARCRAKS